MTRRAKLLAASIVAVAAVLGFGTALTAKRLAAPAASEALPYYDGIGGAFELTNQHGGLTATEDLEGNVVLLFFGYTHCPDVCPATLARLKSVKKALGADAERFRAVFVSVDPQRDTPERLLEYVGFFDPEFIALTGTVDELAAVTKQFGAYFGVPDEQPEAGHFVDHSAYSYLIDPLGKVRALYAADDGWEQMLEGVRVLLAGT